MLKNKGQKSHTWNWDTIVIYNTAGLFTYRYTQTFDSTGKVLTRQIENCYNNVWTLMDRFIFAYDVNGNKTLERQEQ